MTNIFLRGLWFGANLLAYPSALFHEYSHLFMARLMGAEVVGFYINVDKGRTTFDTPSPLKAAIISGAPVIFALCFLVPFVLFEASPSVLDALIAAYLVAAAFPSKSDVKIIIRAVAHYTEAKKNVVEGELIG